MWLFEDESADLPVGDGYAAVPVDLRPIVLGRIRMPTQGLMTPDATSMIRTVQGAHLFQRRVMEPG